MAPRARKVRDHFAAEQVRPRGLQPKHRAGVVCQYNFQLIHPTPGIAWQAPAVHHRQMLEWSCGSTSCVVLHHHWSSCSSKRRRVLLIVRCTVHGRCPVALCYLAQPSAANVVASRRLRRVISLDVARVERGQPQTWLILVEKNGAVPAVARQPAGKAGVAESSAHSWLVWLARPQLQRARERLAVVIRRQHRAV